MPKLLLGALAAAIAMFITGFVFYATPLNMIAFGSLDAAQSANLQAALAQNIAHTGTYIAPDPATAAGTVLYGKGPVAMIHYNSAGFAASNMGGIIQGFIHELIVALILAFALFGIAVRVPDFASRARLVVLFAVAASALIHLGQPIWMHIDWAHAIFCFVADAAMLIAGGLVIARWFLPTAAATASTTASTARVP